MVGKYMNRSFQEGFRPVWLERPMYKSRIYTSLEIYSLDLHLFFWISGFVLHRLLTQTERERDYRSSENLKLVGGVK